MSDTIDLRLLGKMVSRLQSTVEDVRQEYAGIRASLDSLSTSTYQRFAEFNVRMSGLELGQMKLASSVDDAHTKIDRLEIEVGSVRQDQAAMREYMAVLRSEVTDVRGAVTDVSDEMIQIRQQQLNMDGKLDLILSRLNGG